MAASLLLSVASPTKTAAPSLAYSQPIPATAGLCFVSFPSRTKHLRKVDGGSNKGRLFPVKAIEESKESVEDSVTAKEAEEVEASASEESELSAIGAEIKKAMKEREATSDSLAGGVAEEIREIEWPAFGKVLRTTGVVLGVIAGSSVVLLTVNAVLAELSDRVFADSQVVEGGKTEELGRNMMPGGRIRVRKSYDQWAKPRCQRPMCRRDRRISFDNTHEYRSTTHMNIHFQYTQMPSYLYPAPIMVPAVPMPELSHNSGPGSQTAGVCLLHQVSWLISPLLSAQPPSCPWQDQCENRFGLECTENDPSFETHRSRHCHDKPVLLRSSHKR
ncbi:hypothetical protein V6N13_070121 [Hibiscus sabdariffa]